MKEKPILFSDPMVRAILAGTKTQTRRVMKPQPHDPAAGLYGEPEMIHGTGSYTQDHMFAEGFDGGTCPYGQPGDRLWVREAFDPIYGQSPPDRIIEVDYRADWEPHGKHYRMKDEMGLRRWKPSIHMPRDLSRTLLEVVGVRVERLQDISETDAIAEGTPGGHGAIQGYGYNATAIEHYRWLWESINGPGSWDANPSVWVIEFKRVQT